MTDKIEAHIKKFVASKSAITDIIGDKFNLLFSDSGDITPRVIYHILSSDQARHSKGHIKHKFAKILILIIAKSGTHTNELSKSVAVIRSMFERYFLDWQEHTDTLKYYRNNDTDVCVKSVTSMDTGQMQDVLPILGNNYPDIAEKLMFSIGYSYQ